MYFEWHLKYSNTMRPFVFDRRMISQVLRNVFENSLDAADPVRIQVTGTPSASDESARITIADNGPGLSDEQARRFFGPFFTTRMRGIGLGMAISRRIVEAHGDTMHVHTLNGSQPASGTEIVISLPRGSV